MIFDGVLDRFPKLKFGAIELGASWVPGWMRNMDSAALAFVKNEERLQKLSMKPSEFVRRQVRVTPYPHEDAGWIIRNSGEEVCLFSSDFPHVEGGRNPLKRFDEFAAGLHARAGRPLLLRQLHRPDGRGLAKDLRRPKHLACRLTNIIRQWRTNFGQKSGCNNGYGIKDKVAILGMGCSKFGERWDIGRRRADGRGLSRGAPGRRRRDQPDPGRLVRHGDRRAACRQGRHAAVGRAAPAEHPGDAGREFLRVGSEAFRGAVYAVAAGACDIALALGVEKLKDTGYGGLPQREGARWRRCGPRTDRRRAISRSSRRPIAPSTASRRKT